MHVHVCGNSTFVCLFQQAAEQFAHVAETWQLLVVYHTVYEERFFIILS